MYKRRRRSAAVSTTLPETCRTLVCTIPKSGKLTLHHHHTPQPTPGSAVIKVLHVSLESSIEKILKGLSPLTHPVPFTPGARSIGRIAAIGPDTTSLTPGQLVLIEPFIRARDNPDNIQILFGAYDGPVPASKKLMADNWSIASLAEYTRVPLENIIPLNEARLCGSLAEGGLGYTTQELLYITTQAIGYGGLRAINLQAGERVIIAPATGGFSGAAVGVAVAMGAQVIAVGRNKGVLEKLKALFPGRVEAVTPTGELEADIAALKAFGPVDAYLDISPHQASGSKYIRAGMMALENYGRVALQGVVGEDIPIPYAAAVWRNLTIRGAYMYERAWLRDLVKLVESRNLKLGKEGGVKILADFGLQDVESGKGFEFVRQPGNGDAGSVILVSP